LPLINELKRRQGPPFSAESALHATGTVCKLEHVLLKKKRKKLRSLPIESGSETAPASIKEKETIWSEVPYVYPHQVREGREECLENPTTGFHTTSAGAKNQTHPPTRPKQRGQVHQPTDSGQVLT